MSASRIEPSQYVLYNNPEFGARLKSLPPSKFAESSANSRITSAGCLAGVPKTKNQKDLQYENTPPLAQICGSSRPRVPTLRPCGPIMASVSRTLLIDLITFAATGCILLLPLARRETDETFLVTSPARRQPRLYLGKNMISPLPSSTAGRRVKAVPHSHTVSQ
jgi:hypothetical protein